MAGAAATSEARALAAAPRIIGREAVYVPALVGRRTWWRTA